MEEGVKPPQRKVERRLVTILAADFVSYSAHMGANEEATARVLKAHRAVIDGIIAFRDGRIFDTAGDSVLAEFASPVQAVRAALEIQEALQTRNESLEADARMVLRIGINLGDVLVEEGNLMGDAINVAARLESMAKPGGIIVSGAVHDQVVGKIDWGFSDLGTPPLKNIARPIRVLEVTRAPAARAAKPAPKPTRSRIAVLAVLAILLAATAAGAAVWWSVRVAPPQTTAVPAAAPPPSPAAAVPAAPPPPQSAAVPAGPGPASGYLTEEPPMGKLGSGVRVLVDDKTCPDNEIKEVVGGNFYWPDGTKKKEGAVRTRRCIPR
jgi:class 3 adenylate cyclase